MVILDGQLLGTGIEAACEGELDVRPLPGDDRNLARPGGVNDGNWRLYVTVLAAFWSDGTCR
ncbi:MAG: hypothetical protein U0792_23295 [Gemmataceae bacterium]